MNRREMIAGSVAALGAIAGSVPGGMAMALHSHARVRSSTRPARKLKKAVKYGMVQVASTVHDKFRLLRDLGFDGVELDSPGPLQPDEVLKAKEATGLQVPGVVNSVHWTKPLSHRDPAIRAEGLKALQTALRDCKAFGGTSVLLVPAVVNKETSYADAWTRSQEEIRKALPLAKELGIRIAIENVWNNFLLSPLEAARYTDEFSAPDLIGWHFDPGNIVAFGWPEQWIRTLGKRILKIDVKEYSRALRDREGMWKGFNVEIGDGDCDWPAVMAALDEVGYGRGPQPQPGAVGVPDGWAAAEVNGGDENRLRDIHARMCRVLDA